MVSYKTRIINYYYVFSTVDKNEIRAVINFFYFEGKMATEIKSRFDAVFRDSSFSFSIVSFWVSEFKGGRTHTYKHYDQQRSGRSKTVTTPEIVDKIRDVVLANRQIKVREIVEAVRISYERVFCKANLI
jgi:hypothetical protein